MRNWSIKKKMIHFNNLLVVVWMLITSQCRLASAEENSKTPLTRCCKDDQFYRLGLDRCLYQTHHNLDDESAGSSSSRSSPVLYAVGDNDTMLATADEFLISYNLVPCPPGFTATTTTEFQVFVDGKLMLVADDQILQPDQFCISQIPTMDPLNPEFVARYCVPDPCSLDNKLKCLRKCCPPGMAVDIGTHSCQPDSTPFNVSGWVLMDEGSVHFHTGLGFNCGDEDIVEVEDFVITFDDTVQANHDMMHSKTDDADDDKPTDQYCVDNFIEANSTKFMGLRCMPSVTLSTAPSIPENMKKMMEIYPYLLLVSAFFILAAFVAYASLPNFRNKTTISVTCHLASMAVYNIGLAVLKMVASPPAIICLSLPVLIHYASLATFCWLNVLCFDLWWTVRTLKSDQHQRNTNGIGSKKPLIYYSLYGWGIPLIIAVVGQVFQYVEALSNYAIRPDFHLQTACWFSMSQRLPLFTYLYGPITIMFLGNVLFFIMLAITLCKGSKNSDANRQPILGACTVMGVFFLMGGLWMTESVTFLIEESFVTWLVTDILHVTSGVLIFLLFVCNQAVAHALTATCQNTGRRRIYTPEPGNKRPANPRVAKKMTARPSPTDGKRRAASLPDNPRAHYNSSRLDSILLAQDAVAMPLGYRTVDSREWHLP